jgi:hypothetical protein
VIATVIVHDVESNVAIALFYNGWLLWERYDWFVWRSAILAICAIVLIVAVRCWWDLGLGGRGGFDSLCFVAVYVAVQLRLGLPLRGCGRNRLELRLLRTVACRVSG